MAGRKPPLVAERRTPRDAKRPPRKRTGRRVRRGPARVVAALIRGLLRAVVRVGLRVALLGVVVLGLATLYFYAGLPPLKGLLDGRVRGSVTLTDAGGAVFAWRGETFDGDITAANVSPNLRNAVVATEDKRFWRHYGVSPRGIASAIAINLRAGRKPLEGNGGSTITQQVAKLLCLGVPYDPARWKTEAAYEADCRQGSVWRKLKEVPFALALEARYSKADVLTLYFNRAYLGAGARGFEAASQRYFGKSARDVSPAEGAMLAGLLVAPSYYAPTRNLARAQGRASVILGLMAEQGYVTQAQLAEGRAHPATLSSAAKAPQGGAFADWVMDSGPSFLTSDTTEDVTIHTTLDQRIQTAAEAGLAEVFATKLKGGSEVQAAIVVMSADGAIRAMVGGRGSSAAGGFNRAAQALRQTGSAFKPFIYATALDLGASPYDYVVDEPLTLDIRGSGPWTPRNYTGTYAGRVTLTEALAHSLNIPAVKISEGVGRDLVRKVAGDFGIRSDLADGPALALGASEATLLEMTGAYAGILNGGSSVRPYGLTDLTIRGDRTPLIGQTGGIGERVISEKAARELTWMMQAVVEEGTGRRARLKDREAAGKTGTTQAARDAWFIGFTADYVTGVWMGYDDNRPLKGVTGGGLPADIWHAVMARVEDGLPARPLVTAPPPGPVIPFAGSSSETYESGAPARYGADPYAEDGGLADQILRDVQAQPDRQPDRGRDR